jgi:hypothetical protein
MVAIYTLKSSSEGAVGDKVVLKTESVTQENVQELTLNNLQAQLDSAKQQVLDSQVRVKGTEAEILKVKEILGVK